MIRGKLKRVISSIALSAMLVGVFGDAVYAQCNVLLEEDCLIQMDEGDTLENEMLDIQPDVLSDNNIMESEDMLTESVGQVKKTALSDENILYAKDAFSVITHNKDVMALIYLTDDCRIYSDASLSQVVAYLASGHTVFVKGVEFINTDTGYSLYYYVNFYNNGSECAGYVDGKYLAYSDEDWIKWETEYLSEFSEEISNCRNLNFGNDSSFADGYADVERFPASYQSKLNALKAAHPNWTFVPLNTNLDFNNSINSEMGDKSWIYKNDSNSSKGWVGSPTGQANWCYATKSAVEYHMDPRNFLTESYIFQFEQLTYNSSYHTKDAVQSFLNNTFMKGVIPDDTKTYAEAFFEIGSGRKLSPTHLATRVYQEQGKGTSALISGTYSGYEGYYNYFNVGASGSTTTQVIENGLKYAKSKGWNTRYKSLAGGADTIGNGYILKGQDTLYLEKFNVDPNASSAPYTHQYMQNIQAPGSESISTKKVYADSGSLNSSFVFKIPVYNNMPSDFTINKSSVKLAIGETFKLMVKDNGSEIDSSKLTFSSSNTGIATVDSTGVITAKNVGINHQSGSAIITVKYNDAELTCTVTTVDPIKTISLNIEELTLRRPDTVVEDTSNLSKEEKDTNISSFKLVTTFEPSNTTDDMTLTYSSSNTKVAIVDNEGIITSVGTGTAVITVKAAKASASAKPSATCIVTVIAPVYKVAISNITVNCLEENDKYVNVLYKGQSVNLEYEYWPKDTSDSTIPIYTNTNSSVIAVTKGKIEAKSIGSSQIGIKIGSCHSQMQISIKACKVIFMKQDCTTKCKEINLDYGNSLDGNPLIGTGDYPSVEAITQNGNNVVFAGWYTKTNGCGIRVTDEFTFTGEEMTLYPYFAEQSKGFYVLPIGDVTYTGNAIKPEVVVYDSVSINGMEGNTYELVELTLNRDYTVSYKNNKNVNTDLKKPPMVIVKGKGNYVGTEYVYFNIIPKSLKDSDISIENALLNYNGKYQKGNPLIKRNNVSLKNGTDYTLSYTTEGVGAYRDAGTWPVKITGRGGYTGTVVAYEEITRNVLVSKLKIKVSNIVYDKSKIDINNGIGMEPSVSVKYKNKDLILKNEGSVSGDYILKYENNLDVGTAKVTVEAVDGSGYSGSKTFSYKITGIPISKAVISGIENKVFVNDSEAVKQVIANSSDGDGVKLIHNNILLKGIEEEKYNSIDSIEKNKYDYVIYYKNIDNKGTAKISFKGINGFTGVITKSYKISPANFSELYNLYITNGTEKSGLEIKYYTEADAAKHGVAIQKNGIGLLEDEVKDAGVTVKKISTLSDICTEYTKGGARPQLIVYYKGTQLTKFDYSISYKNNNSLSVFVSDEKKAPWIVLTGRGNYCNSARGIITITDGKISDKDKVKIEVNDVVFKPSKNKYISVPVLTDSNGAVLKAGVDYEKSFEYSYDRATPKVKDIAGNDVVRNIGDTVSANDIPQAGTYIKVTIKSKGLYCQISGSGESVVLEPIVRSATYRITGVNINSSAVKVYVKDKTYLNGKAVTLDSGDITLKYGNETLVEGIDYYIDNSSYVNNINRGTASVVVRSTDRFGEGNYNYGGSRRVTFRIKSRSIMWFMK